MPLLASGYLRWPVNLRMAPTVTAARLTLLPQGMALTIDAWATDETGTAWYHAMTPSGSGWVYGDGVTLVSGHPANPAALLAPMEGKGMWLTYALLQRTPVQTIVDAARAAGLSHLYVEVAASYSGFFGGPGLAALLPAAHRAGIRVIAWVYPYLLDLPDDVTLSVAAARFVAPSGDRPDGLLSDVEENMAEGAVRAYGQILRAILGPNELMAIATYPPQWLYGQTYPFATAALSWNVIVPMDYWHAQQRSYSAVEVYRFVRESVQLIRSHTRPDEPVEVLGQMFDPYQGGVDSPSAAEIAACVAAARDAGALGVSFFEWSHATPPEWNALAALPVAGQDPAPTSRAVATQPAAAAGPYVVTIVGALNLRRGPRLAAPVIARLARGSRLVFLGYHTSWVAVVAPGGTRGYVFRRYVSAVLPRAPAAAARTASRTSLRARASRAAPVCPSTCGFKPPFLVVTVPAAHVRAAPTLLAPVLAAEPHGTRLALHGTRGRWALVETQAGLTGWIWRSLTGYAAL